MSANSFEEFRPVTTETVEIPEKILQDTNLIIPGTDRYFYGYPTYPQKNDEAYQKTILNSIKQKFKLNLEDGKLNRLGRLYINTELKKTIDALREKSKDGESFEIKYQRFVDYIDPQHQEPEFFQSYIKVGGKRKSRKNRKSRKRYR